MWKVLARIREAVRSVEGDRQPRRTAETETTRFVDLGPGSMPGHFWA